MGKGTKKPEYQFLHSTYCKLKDENSDYIVANIKNVDTNESELKVITNPKRTVYITKKGLQATHSEKKEYAPISEVDEYVVDNWEMMDRLKDFLGIPRKAYMSMQKLLNNPYVYAADIDIEVLMKQHYMRSTNKVATTIKVGGLDIETSVLGGKEVILNTYTTYDHKIYTAILAPFLKDATLDDVKKCVDASLIEFRNNLNKEAQAIYDQYKPEVTYFVTHSEVEVISWIFEQIHKEKDDFISIWNMGYDIPYFIDRLWYHNVNPARVMCHPEVPKKAQVCNWMPDKTKNPTHWSHKWDFFNLSGYSQFFDSMCLYSRLRKIEGVESSYALKYISAKLLGTGKLDFGEANHTIMQRDRFVEYVAYNIVDTLLLPLMDKLTGDVSSLLLLSENTDLPSFARQTVQLKNWFFDYCKGVNCVPASCKGDQLRPTDQYIKNTGGGVLSPTLARNTGMAKLIETDIPTSLCVMVSDIDVVLISVGTLVAPCSSNAA